MRPPVSDQTRFLLRATLCFGGLLVLWWFVLLTPLVDYARISTDLILSTLTGANLQTGIDVRPNGNWIIQAPATVDGRTRNVRVEAPPRLAKQLTIALPLFWAIILAAPRCTRMWRILGIGTVLLLVLPPTGLLIYTAHVVRIYVYPNAGFIEYVLALADYIASTVAPYFAPVLLALGLHAELRHTVLEGAAPQPLPKVNL